MDAETLKVVGQVAGLGGIALAVVLFIFREVIRKSVFPNLSQQEAYRLLRLVIVSTVVVALGGVGAWVYVKAQDGSADTSRAAGNVADFTISGLVTDSDNNGLGDVEVFVIGSDDHVRSSESGSFRLRTKAPENSVVNVRVSKPGFKAITESVKLPSSGLIVALNAIGVQPTSDGSGRAAAPPPPPSSRTGRIYIRYAGDFLLCNLLLRFQIGDKVVTPTGNFVPVDDIPLGDTAYQISGTIACPTVGACAAHGSGRLNFKAEGNYNVVWQNTTFGGCDVRLIGPQ